MILRWGIPCVYMDIGGGGGSSIWHKGQIWPMEAFYPAHKGNGEQWKLGLLAPLGMAIRGKHGSQQLDLMLLQSPPPLDPAPPHPHHCQTLHPPLPTRLCSSPAGPCTAPTPTAAGPHTSPTSARPCTSPAPAIPYSPVAIGTCAAATTTACHADMVATAAALMTQVRSDLQETQWSGSSLGPQVNLTPLILMLEAVVGKNKLKPEFWDQNQKAQISWNIF